jgi:hypothetical protein
LATETEAGATALRPISFGKSFDELKFHFAKRNFAAVPRQPNPYFTLRRKLIDEASLKYFVGQLISAIV